MDSIQLKFFGVTGDIVGKPEMNWALEKEISCEQLLEQLKLSYPGMKEISTLMMAINLEYADPMDKISPGDIVALIPPVSGG